MKIKTTLAHSTSSGVVSAVHNSFNSSNMFSSMSSLISLKTYIGISPGPAAFLRASLFVVFMNYSMIMFPVRMLTWSVTIGGRGLGMLMSVPGGLPQMCVARNYAAVAALS